MTPLYDMHLHLDWFADPGAAARAMAGAGTGCLGCTVTPDGYVALAPQVEGVPGVRAALGLHPWHLGRGTQASGTFVPAVAEAQTERFCALAAGTRFIGEVGLDFGRAHQGTREAQLAAFRRIVAAVRPGSVVSVHAVRSADVVMDVVEECGAASCAWVFHWFSGSSEELARARRAGWRFSVGPFMLRSKRGREYARQIPQGRLLLETDLPEGRGATMDAAAHRSLLAGACETISTLKNVGGSELATVLAENSAALLDR